MAASIGLAFVLSLRTLQITAPVGGPPLATAMLSPDEELVLFDLDAGADQVLGLAADTPLGVVENILLTRDMTFRDLAADLALMIAEVEM